MRKVLATAKRDRVTLWGIDCRCLIFLSLLFFGTPRSALSADSLAQEQMRSSGDPFLGLVKRPISEFLSRRYISAAPRERRSLANVFYALGWESEELKKALITDIHTNDPELRVSVQYALGRVSSDPEVRAVLRGILLHDQNSFFRDKAGCALANDQIHLDDFERLEVLSFAIEDLESNDPLTRDISLRVLQTMTGQTKGFDPSAPLEQREGPLNEWKRWLLEYRREIGE